jgi:hypothetical protein
MAKKPISFPRDYSLPHLRIDRFAKALDYQQPKPKNFPRVPEGPERFSHGGKLSTGLGLALVAAQGIKQLRDPNIAVGKPNAYFEVVSGVDTLLPDKGWTGVRIGAVRRDPNGTQVGTLFVTGDGETVLSDAIAEYTAGTSTTASTKRLDQIERIAPWTVDSLWMDLRAAPEAGQRIWWECWCWPKTAKHLVQPAARLKLRVSEQRLFFPDFEVVPVYGTREDIEKLLANSDAIAELRHASDTPHVYTHDLRAYQIPILDDLVARITPPPDNAPAACLLDTGVARAHPLLAASLNPADCQSVDDAWGRDDHDGHGTEMAGMALLGDLTYPVGDQRQIILSHRLESVKLLPPDKFPPNEPANLGYVTQSAISLPESEAPDRKRAICMAVTNKGLSGAFPTSWSAAMDQAAAGVMNGDDGNSPRRLIMISAGNVPDEALIVDTMDLTRFPIEDPAQAWNPLTIGGFTDRDTISDPLYLDRTAAAEVGDRSPYSRNSVAWVDAPIKPDLVFEAGNRAFAPTATQYDSGLESLSLLTTNRDHIRDPLTTTWATSPAAAQATRMAAILMAEDATYWPETVRALMVHSAEWTPRMQDRFKTNKGKRKALLLAREFGYGVPNLDRALQSARSDLAIISQATIQPFRMPTKVGARGSPINDGTAKFHHLHLYRLPWPVEELETLGEKRVELKVTLSYFIEPSPGQFAPKTPALYRSHGLRFDLQGRLENEAVFLSRINGLAAADEADEITSEDAVDDNDDEAISVGNEPDDRWRFGSNSRNYKAAGSLHCDVWQGPGVDLAARRTLAVYPVSGWWKTRALKKRYNSKAHYTLIMTLRSLEQDVDLHAPVDVAIKTWIDQDVDV